MFVDIVFFGKKCKINVRKCRTFGAIHTKVCADRRRALKKNDIMHAFAGTGVGMAAMQMSRTTFVKLMEIDRAMHGRPRPGWTLGAVVLVKYPRNTYPSLRRVVDVDRHVVVLSDGVRLPVDCLCDFEMSNLSECTVDPKTTASDWPELAMREATYLRFRDNLPILSMGDVCCRLRQKIAFLGQLPLHLSLCILLLSHAHAHACIQATWSSCHSSKT